MAKSKYKPKTSNTVKSFRRNIGRNAKLGSSILIVTEGVNTEPIYFEAIRRIFAVNAIELVSHGAGRGDPRRLTDFAIDIHKERRRQARSKELIISQLKDFDETWIVFDTDALTAEKRDNGIQYAKGKGIKVAHSEPCFEFWLLLHNKDHYTTTLFQKCAHIQPYLEKAYGWSSYNKNKTETKKRILPLVTKENLETAIEASKRVKKHHEKAGSTFPANPSTSVDCLIDSINNAVAVANKIKTDG